MTCFNIDRGNFQIFDADPSDKYIVQIRMMRLAVLFSGSRDDIDALGMIP